MKQKGKRFIVDEKKKAKCRRYYTPEDKKNIKGNRFIDEKKVDVNPASNDAELDATKQDLGNNEQDVSQIEQLTNDNEQVASANESDADMLDDNTPDVYDVTLESDDEVQTNETVKAQDTTHPLSLREKRKQVKQDKKLRKKQAKQTKPQKETKAEKSAIVKKESSKDNKFRFKFKAKREVLSYEDMPLDDSNRSSFKNISNGFKYNKKRIILSVIILLLMVLVVLAFVNRDQLTFSNFKNFIEYGVFNKDKEEQFPVSTDGDVINNGNFNRIDNNIVYASDTKFVTLNNYGRIIYSYPQTFSSPVLTLASDSDLSLVYNLGGKEFAINTLDTTIHTGEVEDNILVADISKSGVYAIVTAKDGYLSKLYVYTKEHQQIYAYSFADYYITSVSLDPKGTRAVLSGFSAHDGSQLSCVYLLDFTKEEPVVFEEIQDNVVYHVEHLNDNYSCIIGENAAYTLNSRTKELKTTNYDGKSLTAFTVNTDTNTFALSLSRSGDGRMCDVYNFTTSGVMKHSFSTDHAITSLSTYKNRVAALSGDTIYLYTKDGYEIANKKAGLDPHCVVLYSTNNACVLGVNEIRRINL